MDWEVDGRLTRGVGAGTVKVVRGCPASTKTIKIEAKHSKKSRLAET
jgi:hypothetical protein